VAVYSVADGPTATHARMADEAFQIGYGPSPSESYLLQEEILNVAIETGAEAIHPGYGFLSENAKFASAVESTASAAGDGRSIRFVGPPASAIVSMGSKSQSKAIMEEAGVPTTPGYYGDDNQDADFLKQKAIEIGFPLLIKAVMGGGGKGMKIVRNEGEFLAALESARNESRSAFGDEAVLLERYLEQPRHVEVQVVADSHGNVVHLYERDCSLQRRHQKIIEEAPASDLDPAVRHRLGEMAKKAALAVGYVNAGTVEFLLDTKQPDRFYFCEMNTRLQVEHPISEQITGIDLVEWQLRIAAGEALPISDQADIVCSGHAFEARVYAENPARDFLPAAGTVWHHNPPVEINTGSSASGIRVDSGLRPGQDVGVYYDPMISKLITHGSNRQDALRKLIAALKQYQIAGVPNNIEFLIKCAQHPTFGRAGAIHTGFLDDHADDIRMEENECPPAMAQAVGSFAALLLLENRIIGDDGSLAIPCSPWSSLSGSWRMGGESGRARRKLMLEDGECGIECISNRDGSFEIHTVAFGDERAEESKNAIHIAGNLNASGLMDAVVNKTKRIQVKTALNETGNVIRVRMWPQSLDVDEDYFWKLDVLHPLRPGVSGSALLGQSQGLVKSPMPGKINRVNFSVGDMVSEGDVVVVMEAMKMEHAIKAPCDGELIESCHSPGDVVDDGAVLFIVDSGNATGEATAVE